MGACFGTKYHKCKTEAGFGRKKREKILSEGWAQNLANELHQPIRRRFPKRRVYFHMELTTFGQLIWSKWEKFSKWNKGIRYLLMVIDVFSKFGWIRPPERQARANCCRCFSIHIQGASEAKTENALVG